MLEKVECTAGTHHSAQFREGTSRIGDRAQCERREGGITAGVIDRDRLAVEADMLNRDRRRRDSTGGQLPSNLRRFNRKDNVDRRRVVREIKSGAKADLDHPTVQPVGDIRTPPCHSSAPTCAVHETG